MITRHARRKGFSLGHSFGTKAKAFRIFPYNSASISKPFVAMADTTSPGGGWRRPWEGESYLRGGYGECPASVRCDSREGTASWKETEIRNPKVEGRKKSEVRNPKSEVGGRSSLFPGIFCEMIRKEIGSQDLPANYGSTKLTGSEEAGPH